MILAIDPGRDTGWAKMSRAGLDSCGLGVPPLGLSFTRVVIERPQVYPHTPSKQANDLITLAIQVGGYKRDAEAAGTPAELVLPHDWKGSLDADICCRRVVHALREDERSLLYQVLAPLARKPMTDEFLTAGRRHNVIDAVGLALWYAGPRLAGRFTRAA